MAVKLRLMRMGRRHKPFFRLNAMDEQSPRDGKIIEKLGYYDPIEKDPAKQLVLKKERIEFWLNIGAVPSDTVAQLIEKIGITSKHYQQSQAQRKRARLSARKKGVLFDTTQRLQAKKITEKEKAQAEEKTKADTEAKAKTEPEAKTETEAKAETEVKAEAKTKVKTEAKAETKTKSKAKAAPEQKASE
jgi:small subunit ribosomal protein S16